MGRLRYAKGIARGIGMAKNMKQNLYPWQEECLTRWFANGGKGMVQAATGSGKTLLALTAADRLAQTTALELHVKIIVPTTALMNQWSRAIKDFHGDRVPDCIGLCGGGYQTPPNRPYTIYVVNSARYQLARQILSELRSGYAVLLIADECHHYVSGQNQLIFEFLPYIRPDIDHFFSLGLSATLPVGSAGQILADALGHRIYNYEISTASARHTVCPYDIFHIGLSFREEELADYNELTERMTILYTRLLKFCPELKQQGQKERFELLRSLSGSRDRSISCTARQYMHLTYTRKNLVCMASERLDCAEDLICQLGTQDKIIVFGERILQAEELYQRLNGQYPGRIGRYHSKLGAQANRNALDRFRCGDTRVLIACKAIDEGVDIPDAAIGIILSGTSTRRQRIQRMGRIIRPQKEKSKALLYYLHITDSSEDSCFLPDIGQAHIFELESDPDSNMFSNPPYVHQARQFLERINANGFTEEKMQEIKRCLALGSIRTDWTLPEEILTERSKNAVSMREKNYWICMKKLAECRS